MSIIFPLFFRYGEGYTITIKVIGGDSNYEKVKNSIKLSFNNAVIKESHCNMLIVSTFVIQVLKKIVYLVNYNLPGETNCIKLWEKRYEEAELTTRM